MGIEKFYSDGAELVAIVEAFVEKYGLTGRVGADHICFKCGSSQVFEEMRAMLEPQSVFVYQSYISKRRIAVIKLKKEFNTKLGPISVLELSDQKPDNSQTTRFDHIEIYPVGLTYEELVAVLEKQNVTLEKTERPHHTTYDIPLHAGYQLKLTRELLLEKIKRDEMR